MAGRPFSATRAIQFGIKLLGLRFLARRFLELGKCPPLRMPHFRGNIHSMTASLLTLTHMDAGVRFYPQNDQRAFFEWLSRISCVESYAGDGRRGLVVQLKRRPGKDDL